MCRRFLSGLISCSGGQWDFDNYHIVTLGEGDVSVRCMTVVSNQRIWCAHRNCVHVVNPTTLKIEVLTCYLYFLVVATAFNRAKQLC